MFHMSRPSRNEFRVSTKLPQINIYYTQLAQNNTYMEACTKFNAELDEFLHNILKHLL